MKSKTLEIIIRTCLFTICAPVIIGIGIFFNCMIVTIFLGFLSSEILSYVVIVMSIAELIIALIYFLGGSNE